AGGCLRPVKVKQVNIHAFSRNQFIRTLQVCSRERDSGAGGRAVYHLALERVGTAQQPARQSHLSRQQRLADRGTRNPATAKLDLADLSDCKTLFPTDLLQKIETPFPAMAEGEVGSDVNFLQLHPVPQDSASEIASAGLGKLNCKWDHYDQPDPERFDGNQFLVQGLDLSGRVVGRQYLKRVWIKSYYGRS